MTIHPKRACPACGDDSHLYRKTDEIWNPASEEWEFSGTEGAVECTTCDWSGTEDETEGPLCQGCGKPEAACSANPCAAVAADWGDDKGGLIARLVEALEASKSAMDEYYRYWTGGEMPRSYDGKPERRALWEARECARTALAVARGEG